MLQAARRPLRPVKRLYRRISGRLTRFHEPTRRTSYRGLTLVYPSRSIIARNVADAGWLESLRATVDGVSSTQPFVVDVGANVGAAILAIKSARPEARILSVEPSPRFAPYLRRTIAANRWKDVTVVEVLVGASTGELLLHSTTASGSIVHAGEDGSRQEPVRDDVMPMTTLDELVNEPVDVLKIDTDGYDLDVLKGASRILSTHPAIHVEYAPSLLKGASREPIELPRLLREAGYELIEMYSSDGALIGKTSVPEEVLAEANQHGGIDLVVRPQP